MLVGYPKTRDQALALQRHGIFAKHVGELSCEILKIFPGWFRAIPSFDIDVILCSLRNMFINKLNLNSNDKLKWNVSLDTKWGAYFFDFQYKALIAHH
jgi:hypothetical protein